MTDRRIPGKEWLGQHRGLVMGLGVAILLLIILCESFLLYQQRVVNRAAASHSGELLTAFLQGDTARAGTAAGVPMRLENVRFKWSDKVYIDAGNMAVRAVPLEGTTVNFDDLTSFQLSVQQSVVLIGPDVLEGMLNESIFNFPESRVRELKVALLLDDKGKHAVRLTGRINTGVWLPFEMLAHLLVDTKTNTLVFEVDNVKALGVPATKFLRWTPFHLDRLIALPPNHSMMVVGQRIMVKPFALFPPPRINGQITDVEVDDKAIRLTFAGRPIAAPASSAKNYIYLRGGTSEFGNFRMVDTDVLILDQDQANPFRFSLLHYAEMIPRSKVEIHDTRSVRITMPDF
jgi:hypothetical protein